MLPTCFPHSPPRSPTLIMAVNPTKHSAAFIQVSTEVYLQCCLVVSLYGWYVPREMLPSRRTFCVYHTTTHQFIVLFCQKCRWQVTAKHACTFRMWLCMKGHGAWLYGVHRTRRDGSSFMWHQPFQRCKYTTSVDIKKRAIKKSCSLM